MGIRISILQVSKRIQYWKVSILRPRYVSSVSGFGAPRVRCLHSWNSHSRGDTWRYCTAQNNTGMEQALGRWEIKSYVVTACWGWMLNYYSHPIATPSMTTLQLKSCQFLMLQLSSTANKETLIAVSAPSDRLWSILTWSLPAHPLPWQWSLQSVELLQACYLVYLEVALGMGILQLLLPLMPACSQDWPQFPL